MRFNHKQFFDGARGFLAKHDKSLTPERVSGLDFLLTSFEESLLWSDLRCIAYALATICVETAWTFHPIQEFGSYGYFERRYGSATRKGRELGNDATGEGAKYSGKGYVQLTGESNYEKLEQKLRNQFPELIEQYDAGHGTTFDLTDHAEQAKDPDLAFAIMTIGMFQGVYTGHKFSEYITRTGANYKDCRRIINGQDRASEIAGYAREWQEILTVSAAAPAVAPSETQPRSTSTASDASQSPPDIVQPPIQNAETIVNTGDVAPPAPVPQDVTIAAPAAMGSVSSATKVTIAGITVPPLLLAAVDAVKGWIHDGYIDAREVANVVISLIQNNTKYIFLAVGGVVLVIIVKKIAREVIFLVTIITHAVPGWNNVTVVAPEPKPPRKHWWEFWHGREIKAPAPVVPPVVVPRPVPPPEM